MQKTHQIVLIGSGWSGFSFLRRLGKPTTVISPRNHFVFTPLLASTTVGTLEFRNVVEPIRKIPNANYYEGSCSEVDFKNKLVKYSDHMGNMHTVPYDKLVLGHGNIPNTFGIPGAKENALFLREIHHARKIRKGIIEALENAAHPDLTEAERKKQLHFCIVGAGATGVEFSGELYDFIRSDILQAYPTLAPLVKITLFDVGDRILGTFDKHLSDYASKKFMRDGIHMRLSTKIIKVHKHALELLTGEMVPFGLLVWSTGLTEHPLTAKLNLDKSHGRLLVDEFCRVSSNKQVHEDVYAIGDCAVGASEHLPQTAQVAAQEGIYLAKQLSKPGPPEPFKYRHFVTMAYIGSWKSVIDKPGVGHLQGTLAWLIWRGAYFSQTVSLKNKLLIPIYWFVSWVFGREISRIKE